MIVFGFIAYYTDQQMQITFLAIGQSINAFIMKPMVDDVTLNLQSVTLKLYLVIGMFILNSLLAAIIHYITTLHIRLKASNI